MRREHTSALLVSTLVGAGAFLLALQACTVTTPGGQKWTVGPAQPGSPAKGVVVGTFVGPDGKTYKLIDVNGDGIPDFAQGPDGSWRKITPPNEPTPQQPVGAQPGGGVTNGTGTSTGSLGTVSSAELALWRNWNSYWSGGVDWDSGIEPAMPFSFGNLDASDWIAYYGMDIPAGQAAETSGLGLNVFNTTTLYTDATFFSSTDFVIPDAEDLGLSYEYYALLGGAQEPDFLVMRVAGPINNVIRFAFEVGDGVQEFEFTNNGAQWLVVADEGLMEAALYQNGTYVGQIPIN